MCEEGSVVSGSLLLSLGSPLCPPLLRLTLTSLTLGFLAGAIFSGNRVPSFSSSPFWEAGLGLWQLRLGALSSAVGGGGKEKLQEQVCPSCPAALTPLPSSSPSASTLPSPSIAMWPSPLEGALAWLPPHRAGPWLALVRLGPQAWLPQFRAAVPQGPAKAAAWHSQNSCLLI